VVFQSLADTSPVTFADLSGKVHDYWDRGLLGLALDPNFPASPYVYVLYALDARIGGTAPTWNDACPTPPGPTTDGCLVGARLSRLQASGNTMTGSEQVLIEDWCQQYPSHSAGTLLFGRDGKLYVSGGEGASFNNVDYGQYGAFYAGGQANPCGDPPAPAGTALSAPTAEGGALRSQSVRRTDGPATLGGAILRVDPATGQGLPDNPFGSSADANARRIVGYGLRNPFRFTQRPGTDELYATPGSVAPPWYAYHHGQCVVSYAGCRTGSSSITALAFYQGGSYPAAYNGALFFGDYSRNEIWAMLPGTNGLPDPGRIQSFVGIDGAGGAGHPVDLKVGPGGDLFYVDMEGGSVHRITYSVANQPPTARIVATPTSGSAPLTVRFDGTGSTDPEGGPLSYTWDLDGDGTFGDATGPQPSHTYAAAGTYAARLRVTDAQGASDTASVTITVGNTPPTPVIDTPGAGFAWRVGDTISFSGHAGDGQDGALPPSALSWSAVLHHCYSPTDCHSHAVQDFAGVAGGSFAAPDHQYPCWLELRLTARDSGGLTATTSVRLDPRTVVLTFKTNPGGLKLSDLTFNESARATPFSVTVVVGSTNSVSAPSPQTFNRSTYYFTAWSDGGPASHEVVAPATNATYTASYRKR
jgi:PKD repeat protein/glucose/arabinose dehydrogenase